MPSLDARGKLNLPMTTRFLWVVVEDAHEEPARKGFRAFNFL
jgi:hypothetical protein